MKFPAKPLVVIIPALAIWCSCQPSDYTGNLTDDSTQVHNKAEDTTDLSGVLKMEDGTPRYVQGEWTEEKGMAVVYGLYDKGMECSKWVCLPSERKTLGDKIDPEGMLYTRASGHFEFKTAEGRKIMLVTETLERNAGGWEDCHACAPILGLATFGEIDGDWFVESLRRDLETIGSWGKLPPHELVQLGPDNFGVLFEPGYTQMGINETSFYLTGIVDGKFETLLDVESGYSNTGYYFEDFHPEKAYSFASTTQWVKGSNPQWYDLEIVTEGTRPLSGEEDGDDIRPFKETSVYKFGESNYVLADKVTDVN